MIQVELYYMTSTIAMNRHLSSTEGWTLRLVCKHKSTRKSHSIVKEGSELVRGLSINLKLDEEPETIAIKIAK